MTPAAGAYCYSLTTAKKVPGAAALVEPEGGKVITSPSSQTLLVSSSLISNVGPARAAFDVLFGSVRFPAQISLPPFTATATVTMEALARVMPAPQRTM